MGRHKKINQAKALELIKNVSFRNDYHVVFDNQSVYGPDAILLGKSGILVTVELIKYDDNTLDYSDIPTLSVKDIENGKYNGSSMLRYHLIMRSVHG